MPSRSGPISPKNHEEPHALLSCCKLSRTLTRKTLPHSICCPPDKMRTKIWPNGPKSSHGTGTFGLDVRTLRPASSSPLSPAGIAAAGCSLRKARTGEPRPSFGLVSNPGTQEWLVSFWFPFKPTQKQERHAHLRGAMKNSGQRFPCDGSMILWLLPNRESLESQGSSRLEGCLQMFGKRS